ncbi:MAG: hypothetical protein ACFWTR_12275 [Pseudomonas shahriarae]|jgi:hypothetical protein
MFAVHLVGVPLFLPIEKRNFTVIQMGVACVGTGLPAMAIGIYTTIFLVCVHIHCCGHGHLGFRPYGGSLWRSAKVSKALLPHHSVPRLGSACPQSGIAPWARRDRPSMAVSRLPRHPCRGAHCAIPACGQRGLTGRLRSRSKARSKAEQQQQQSRGAKLHSPPVGAGLPAMAVYQPIHLSTETPSSQASQLPQESAYASRIRSAVRPPRFALILILGAPLNHAGRHPILIWGVTRQDAGLAALGHGWPIAAAPQINVG